MQPAEIHGGDSPAAATPAERWPAVVNVSHNHFIAGGSDRMFLDTGRILESRGHRVIPFCAADERNEATEWQSYFPAGVNTASPSVTDLGRFIYSRQAGRSLRRLLADQPVDLAHLHIYYGKLTAAVLKPLREKRIPIVQTLHEYKLVCPVYTLTSSGRACSACSGGRFWNALPRLCNRGSLGRTALSVVESYVSAALGAVSEVDHFIGISDYVTARMIEMGVPADRITTVHNFVDTENYRPEYTPGDYVVYFGRIESVKGIYTLLEAMSQLPDIRLLVAGTGTEQADVARWIEARGVDNIELLGFREGEALHTLLQGALCTVVPSEWDEPFGLTVVESMAFGKPVVATRVGGITEIVADEEDGLLVDPWDPEALRAAIRTLAANPARAAEMGRAGRAKVERLFNRERYYEGLCEVYGKATAAAEQRP